MRTVEQSELGEAAIRLIREAGEQSIVIRDGEQAIGAIVSMEEYLRMRRVDWLEIDRISREAGLKVEAHAAELGISPDVLVERLLRDEE